ncbi:hypothetical protein [Pseudarthrobacter sp. N5]|uniref:hypothetical protein n=1 Tax=Pseudarthrobacter sp. N5 TaxID=3418416 RepID=UPI003CEE5AF7
MTNPSDVPQPEQPGAQPPASNVPPAGYQPPQGYQQPPSYQATGQGYGQAGQPGYAAPMGAANNAPPAGLGYTAPARNTFGLDFNNIGERISNTQGAPQQLVISYWLWIAAAALGVVLSVVSMFTITNALGGLMVGAGITALIISVVFAAFYVFIAIRLKEGARWARLVLSILGGLALISFLLQLTTGNLNFIGSAVAAAAAVLMWLPQSQEHFKS